MALKINVKNLHFGLAMDDEILFYFQTGPLYSILKVK